MTASRNVAIGLLALIAGTVGLPADVAAIEGRYVGSINRSEGGDDVSSTLHNYDVGTWKSLSNGVDMNLRLSLRYQARLGQADSDLLGSRLFGDVRAAAWRLRGQWTPWQNQAAGPSPPRDRSGQVGFALTPRGLPQLDMNYSRVDGQSSIGRSLSDDRRVNLSWSRGIFQTGGGYRRLFRELRDSSTPDARTEEWKANTAVTKAWRGLSMRAAWDYLTTRYASAARRRHADAHGLDLSTTWQPIRKISLGGTAILRRGMTEDNALPDVRDVDERSLSAVAGIRPWTSLDLVASREYRRTAVSSGHEISDYGRLQATFRRPLLRRVTFQTGYQKNVDLTDGGPVPADNVYVQADGPIRRGLFARGELRTATSGTAPGRQWRRLAQLRGDPVPEMHIETTWRHDSMPDSLGPGQTQDEWNVTTSFAPESVFGIVANARWQKGTGRVASLERLANLLLTWKSSDRSQISFTWSRRRSTTAGLVSRENTYGIDVQMWLPGDYRISGSAREFSGRNHEDNRNYSLAVEKSF